MKTPFTRLFTSRITIIATTIVVISAGVVWYLHTSAQAQHDNAMKAANAKLAQAAKEHTSIHSKATTENTPPPSQPAATPTPRATPKPTTSKPTPTPTAAPAPTQATTPIVNTTNCLPPDASVYDKYYISMSNTDFMQSDAYGSTPEFYNALRFAGLDGVVNGKQTVVFILTDYVFDHTLTAAQKTWMNASPANMRSVLGWHIITNCTIWHNDIENAKSTVTLTTLNGTVTYHPGSPGSVNSAGMAMWDWFTSNGAVHYITGFIVPPAV